MTLTATPGLFAYYSVCADYFDAMMAAVALHAAMVIRDGHPPMQVFRECIYPSLPIFKCSGPVRGHIKCDNLSADCLSSQDVACMVVFNIPAGRQLSHGGTTDKL